ncbi:hypothetical protein CsatA_009033 [Cannabis sativa]
MRRWEAYARLYKKVTDEWWCEPRHGDWCTCLEKYTLSRDDISIWALVADLSTGH